MKGVISMEKTEERFMIMTNIDGVIFSNIFPDKALPYDEAIKSLALVRRSDPNARLVKVELITDD